MLYAFGTTGAPRRFAVKLQVDADRANLAGVSNQDVALSSAAGISGFPVSTLREGFNQIPIVARLRLQESAQLSDIKNLYVYSLQGAQRVPLGQVASVSYVSETPRIRRRNQFRTITVGAFSNPPAMPADVMDAARARLVEFGKSLPPGYTWGIGGEEEEQNAGFLEVSVAMGVSIVAIFLALAFQFRSAMKPVLVFGAIPYGVVGALAALAIMGAPFGFMAFLGIASLIGVIVSHIIVLFDFIEEAHERGAPLARGPTRCRHSASAPGADHRRRHGIRTCSAGPAWRAALGAALLCADRRADTGDVHYVVTGTGALLHIRSGS